jgi:hypothetical protein
VTRFAVLVTRFAILVTRFVALVTRFVIFVTRFAALVTAFAALAATRTARSPTRPYPRPRSQPAPTGPRPEATGAAKPAPRRAQRKNVEEDAKRTAAPEGQRSPPLPRSSMQDWRERCFATRFQLFGVSEWLLQADAKRCMGVRAKKKTGRFYGLSWSLRLSASGACDFAFSRKTLLRETTGWDRIHC